MIIDTARNPIEQAPYEEAPATQEDILSEEESSQTNQDERPELQELQRIVSQALQGDETAFSTIVEMYSGLMIRTASMIVGDRDIAEDVVQDALIQAWHHLPDLREASALRPWLMRIVVNQCISFKRRLTRTTNFIRQALSEQETDLIAQAADDFKGRMERDWDLVQAIEKLPTKQRVVVILHYYNGMTLPEMSQTLQTSENTLKKRIQSALINLRRVMYAAEAEERKVNLPTGQKIAISLI